MSRWGFERRERRMADREIRCPNCGTVIKIDGSAYDSIVKQVRDDEFASELEKQKADALRLARAEAESVLKDRLSAKDEVIIELEKKYQEFKARADVDSARKETDNQQALAEKDRIIAELRNDLNNEQLKSRNAVSEAMADAEKKIATLENELANRDERFRDFADKAKLDRELELQKADARSREEINNLSSQISVLNEQFRSKEESIRNNYESQLSAMQEQVEFYKNFKAKQSTKAIGEDLEHYCENQFNKNLRPILPNCYFEKDNVVSKQSGSKGDFIFRDFDDGKVEVVSVMIECKNEADETEKKHKNEDFFKELDKDRKEKDCEYAVLVSTLEADNDYYNEGIVDVSYRYDKMYVVRPQQLIPLLTLLRNSSLKALDYKKELIVARSQNLDVAHFEENMNTFKEGFARNYDLASRKFKTAIEEIDKTIDHLQKTRDALLSSENNLRLANNKAQDLSIKKLTHNAPSVAEKLKEAAEGKGE